MYLGSVSFFKHLILTIAALLIIVPAAVAVGVGADNAAKKREISDLKAVIASYGDFAGGKDMSAEDYYGYMDLFNIDKTAFFQMLYEKDPGLLDTLNGGGGTASPGEPGDSNAPEMTKDPNIIATPKETASEPPGTEPPPPSYAGLYPDLYVANREDEPRYIDDSNYIYLTFDDGPSKHTDEILSYLKAYGVPATFFVVPDENSGKALNKILAGGHAVGVHSASHKYEEIYASVEAFLEDFNAAYELIYEQTGIKPEFFRFPGGSVNDFNGGVRDDIIAEMTRRGFVFFDWNVDVKDAEGAGWDAMMKTAREEVTANTDMGRRSIILLHDWNGGVNTVYVLDEMIEMLKNDPNGYEFGKIDRNVRPLRH
ncbi:MAG: polysaccharide deacetylase [Oscillospiraceae bacterium]|nr:polysaccharide deacetylase [Oscillospiraceae bacterium]